jgi:hypothetical protein
MGWTRAETDVAEVMIWLRGNHGRELSYADIAAGVGIKDGARLRRAVCVVRVVAANRGDRLERFQPSADPARRRVWTTRYMREGHGDEFSARDAMSAARAAMTSVKDMHRATTYEAATRTRSPARSSPPWPKPPTSASRRCPASPRSASRRSGTRTPACWPR